MKKKYSTPNLIKVVSLSTVMATLLSSVSPVFAANFAFVGGNNNSTSLAGVSYAHGSHGSVVLAGDDDFCGADNVIGRGGKQQQGIADNQRITAEDQYNRFINGYTGTNGRNAYGTTTQQVTWQSDGTLTNNATYMGIATGGVSSAMPEAYGVYSFATGCGSAATGNYSTVFGAGATAKAGGAQAFGVSALASGIASVAMGVGSEASGESTVAIGGLATALGENSIAVGTKARAEKNFAIALGTDAEAKGSGSIAIGGRRSDRTEESAPKRKVIAEGENAIAIGSHTYAKTEDSVAIGANAQVLVNDGVAIGGGSVSDRNKGVKGYDPYLNGDTTETGMAWVSTTGAFSVGEVGGTGNGNLTRQITGVAAGSRDTDAVNVAQLKAMKDVIAGGGGWKLSANDKDPTDVHTGNTVDFSVKSKNDEGKDNLTVAKNTEANKHKIEFTLNDHLKLMQVTTGQSSMSDDGFFVDGGENSSRMTVDGFYVNDGKGPSMSVDGIDAGYTNIRNLLDATEDGEAVNFGQLKEYVKKNGGGWKLAVEENQALDINPGNTVHFFAVEAEDTGHKNIKIANTNGKNVSFDLADDINVMTVKTGKSIMDAAGFRFDGDEGPSITVNGIDAGNKKITKVAKAEDDTDAVNYEQLKEVKILAENGWKLSVDGNNATDVKAGSKVDLVAGASEDGSKNIKIAKDNNNRVTFTLNDTLNLTSVTTGNSIMSDNGFGFVDGGPSITTNGIDAGDKKITGVAAGEDDADAVSYKQLKDFTAGMATGWKLSVNGEGATDVKAGSTVNFVAVKQKDDDNNESENTNIKIVKSEDNQVSFDLSEYIKVGRVETGDSRMSNAGFMIKDGPNMTKGGINAAKTQIKGVADGSDEHDAVNLSQLYKMKFEIEDNSLVKWSKSKNLITIGAEKEGIEIKVANSEGKDRIISGVAVGKVSSDSTEAINGHQLFNYAANISEYFGGETNVIDGIKPTFMVQNTKHSNVTDAFKDIDSSITDIYSQINNVTSNNLVKWDEGEKLITIGKEKGGTKINITGTDGGRTITGVKNGEISKDSMEAVNGSQINTIAGDIANYFGGNAKFINGAFVKPRYNLTTIEADGTVKQKEHNDVGSALSGLDTNIRIVNANLISGFNDVAKYFGGGAGYDENGEWHAPTFQVYHIGDNGAVSKKPYQNVADAFEGVNNTFTNIHNQISDITKNSLVKQEGEDGLITVGKETGGTKISIANKDNQERTLFGIKDGEISQASKEAVNGSQLFKVAENTSKYFGGSTDVLSGIEPTFLIDGTAYDNVTDAFTGVNISIHKIDDKISDVIKNSLVKQDGGASGVITIGKDTAGTEINIAGVGGSGRKISGVREAENGDEAVNKDQLDKSIKDITKDIETATAAAVLYDKNGDDSVNYGSVTLGGNKSNGPVALHNVKDGSLSQDSHDAINGSQINKISADIAKFFGGGAKFIDGAFKGLKYTVSAIVDGVVGKANFYNVGDALTGLDKNVQDVNQRLTNVSNEFNQKIEDFSKDALLWDDDEEAFVARHEKDGQKTKSKLKYLLDGEIAQGSTDAITGNQLYSMNNQLANYFGGGAKYENGKWTNPTFKIVQVNADGTTVEKEHHNVADAFGDINNGMSNINNRIDDVINKVDTDALKWNDKEKAYDANRDGKPNKIINVADGKIVKGSKDAVNGGQLWETNERVTGVEKDVKHLTNRVDNISNTIADIGDVVLNIDTKVDNINNRVDGIEEDAVRYDRDANGKKTNKITLAGGDASEPVLIDNVADGKIEKGSKEAVNGGQLHDYTKEQMKIILDESKHYTDQRVNNIVIDAIDDAVDQSKQYTDMKFNVLNYSIESVKKEARQAAAIGLAVSNLRYNDTPGKLSVGFGTGLWRSQSAFAFGAGYTSENGKYRSNISATTSGGHWGVGAGFNMTLN
ncbi:Vomp family autotransporter [Bartonella sp. CL436QHHD]|uniref:Vomp family autotransporter n=1 Tax=Bartonella sp. CL436QHHD TaxID=3243531 RepID=UPI0035CFBF0C